MQTSARPVSLRVLASDGPARTGELRTRRGIVRTPAFMPVGTAGSVKGILPWQLRDLGAEIVLANTYHLHLRPGEEVVEALGGLHAFSGWDGPVLTDSGGYQVFSHAQRRSIDERGVIFRDHLEGRTRELTPERAIAIQQALGADIMMPLDDCTGMPTDRDQAAAAMERTLRWLPRNVAARTEPEAALFGIVQGGVFDDLREESLERTVEHDLDGYALGGVSVGEGRDRIRRVVARFGPRLPGDRPRYLMGIGLPEDILAAVESGIDMFDCVIPTRHARNAQLFTSDGRINIRNARFRTDPEPIDPGCGCPVCRRLSRAYLRHLYVAGEILASVAGTVHNLWFYLNLMRRIREAIAAGALAELRAELVARGTVPEETGR
jgi:queuine tRNA-ribosyltransferase